MGNFQYVPPCPDYCRKQHVHRYLWRDLQSDILPDVYVKTVLTFGDKPSPAMAQITLPRTAKDGEEIKMHPEAVRVIQEDVYIMDDNVFLSKDNKQCC